MLLNGHYVNTWAMQYAAGDFAHELPEGTRVYPFAYWLGLPPDRAARYLGPDLGIHANAGDTSAILAIDPALCDMEHARDFTPDFGDLHTSPYTVLDAAMFARPGAFHAATAEGGGVWGSPTDSTAEAGDEFLDWCQEAVVNVVRDLEAVHERLDAIP